MHPCDCIPHVRVAEGEELINSENCPGQASLALFPAGILRWGLKKKETPSDRGVGVTGSVQTSRPPFFGLPLWPVCQRNLSKAGNICVRAEHWLPVPPGCLWIFCVANPARWIISPKLTMPFSGRWKLIFYLVFPQIRAILDFDFSYPRFQCKAISSPSIAQLVGFASAGYRVGEACWTSSLRPSNESRSPNRSWGVVAQTFGFRPLLSSCNLACFFFFYY